MIHQKLHNYEHRIYNMWLLWRRQHGYMNQLILQPFIHNVFKLQTTEIFICMGLIWPFIKLLWPFIIIIISVKWSEQVKTSMNSVMPRSPTSAPPQDTSRTVNLGSQRLSALWKRRDRARATVSNKWVPFTDWPVAQLVLRAPINTEKSTRDNPHMVQSTLQPLQLLRKVPRQDDSFHSWIYVWVAGKTVLTRAISECTRGGYDDTNRRLLYVYFMFTY